MRIALITGATSGMGKEMVSRVISERTDVDEIWLLGRRTNRLEAWQKHYPEITFRLFSVDLSNQEECSDFYSTLEEEAPQIAVFVHAAGFGIMGDIAEIPTQELEEMADINVRSVVAVTGHVLPLMEREGRMIYFASSAAFLPQPGFAVYAASKAFVLSYVRALRAESRHRALKITAVCPGAVKTEFFNRAAKNHELPAYKKMVMADARSVVNKAWKDNLHNRELSIYGVPMKLFYAAAKIVPHAWILAFMGSKTDRTQTT